MIEIKASSGDVEITIKVPKKSWSKIPQDSRMPHVKRMLVALLDTMNSRDS